MATNVLELRRYNPTAASAALVERVSIAEKADIAAAAAALGHAAHGLGLRLMVWHDLATLEPMRDAEGAVLNAAVLGWSAQELAPWHCRDRMLASPLLRACRVESAPFWANRNGIRTRWRNRVIEQIGLEEFEKQAGLRAAIVIPVHLPFGQVGGAILTSLDPLADDLADPLARCIETLAPALERFIRGYVMVSRDERYLPDDSLLTSREIECLNWIAHGKTDFEIGIILGCSHAGVRYHVTRACAKLGAVNRAQSVFRAAQLGLLGTPAPASARPPIG
jgi:DNA-binding CsgD family transcriptional regulator